MQTPMETSYEDFEPFCKWKREKNSDTLEVHLPGFKRHQLKVQLSGSGNLIITGERQMEEDKSKKSRFCKQFLVPADFQADQIQAKFSHGILYLVMPKQIISGFNAEASAGAGLSSTMGRNNKRIAMEIIVVVCLAMAVGAYVKKYCHCSHLWN